MRRKYFGLAIAAFATLGPMQAWGGDREIAEQIIKQLKSTRDSGALKDFTLDMKVDSGVVLFRGNVSQEDQKELVLAAADGIEGVTRIRDEVVVTSAAPSVIKPNAPVAVIDDAPMPVKVKRFSIDSEPQGEVVYQDSKANQVTENDFSFRDALADQAKAIRVPSVQVMPGEIRRTAAVEPTNDTQVVSAVVAALSKAKDSGQLKGFGVDVKSQNGVLQLTGRASSAAQRNVILQIAEGVPGVAGVREAIAIPTYAPNPPRLPEPPSLQDVNSLAPVAVDAVNRPGRTGVPASAASAPVGLPAMAAPFRTQAGMQTPGMQAGIRGPIAGQPVPMAPYSAVGAPRYDSPNLPNYAWPGYAAHPNYAAVTYPQQYSPSAWPYIGPFYPYPQVPLGWRKVSLEWDDGWWFLDFTDR